MSDDQRIHVDRPHDGKPEHVDVTNPIPEVGGAYKFEIGPTGDTIKEQVWIGKQNTDL